MRAWSLSRLKTLVRVHASAVSDKHVQCFPKSTTPSGSAKYGAVAIKHNAAGKHTRAAAVGCVCVLWLQLWHIYDNRLQRYLVFVRQDTVNLRGWEDFEKHSDKECHGFFSHDRGIMCRAGGENKRSLWHLHFLHWKERAEGKLGGVARPKLCDSLLKLLPKYGLRRKSIISWRDPSHCSYIFYLPAERAPCTVECFQ